MSIYASSSRRESLSFQCPSCWSHASLWTWVMVSILCDSYRQGHDNLPASQSSTIQSILRKPAEHAKLLQINLLSWSIWFHLTLPPYSKLGQVQQNPAWVPICTPYAIANSYFIWIQAQREWDDGELASGCWKHTMKRWRPSWQIAM